VIKLKKLSAIVFASVLPLLLSGCKAVMLDPKGIIASQEKYIILFSAALMLIVVIPVILLTLIFSWRYREENIKATYAPEWAHSLFLEIIWWSIPCVIIVVLGAVTWISSHRLDPYRPLVATNKPITIEVIALRWKWLFIYPEQNIATINFIQFPVNVPVRFLITSEGPMNSFQIPQLGGQIYAMAGMQTKLHLMADTEGDYQGLSSNFSGDGFSGMKFIAKASTPEAFNRWVKSVKKSQASLTVEVYRQLLVPRSEVPVRYYSPINKDIFNHVVMKGMMPMPDVTEGK